jgi:hypothetical protein
MFAFGVVRQLFETRVSGADASERETLFAGPAAAAWPPLWGQLGDGSVTDISFAVLSGRS